MSQNLITRDFVTGDPCAARNAAKRRRREEATNEEEP